MASLFDKLRSNNTSDYSNPFMSNNNTSSSNWNGGGFNIQSKGFDNTDRAPGYAPRIMPINSNQIPDFGPMNNQPQTANPPKSGGGFAFPQPGQGNNNNRNTPQKSIESQNQPPVTYQNEYYTYQYPSKGEIWGDLALRVFEVVVGAAAVAAGHEIAKFFSRRRFQSPIQTMYEHPQNYNNNYNNNNNGNWWNK